MLTEIINKETGKNRDKVIATLRKGICDKFQLFPDKIMHGFIIDNKIRAFISPPFGFVDPFKSRVTGIIENNNNKTEIQLKVNPSFVIIGFIMIWIGLIIFMIITHNFRDILNSLGFIGIAIIFTIIPFGLAKIKIRWDKKRLENWIDKEIKNIV
ncbi:MAG: hypothetical protein Q8907_08085 [Bacteroidota bacterium]|nr:hypothetical protein [Bacteroidota bacterium]